MSVILIPAKLSRSAFNSTSLISPLTQLFNVRNPTFHVLRRPDPFMGAAARSAKNEKKEECEGEKRREKESHLAPPPFLNHFHAYKECPVLFFLSQRLLCICVLEDLLLFSLSFDCPKSHLRWFVEKHRFKHGTSTQTCLTTHLLELSSRLESITIHDLRRSIKTIDRPLFTLIQPIFTSIVLRDCGEGQSASMFIL